MAVAARARNHRFRICARQWEYATKGDMMKSGADMKIGYYAIGLALGFAASASAQAQGLIIKPGLWQSSIRMSMAPNPKIPPQIMAKLAQPRVTKKCITPALAAKAATDHFGSDKLLAKRNCTRTGAGFVGGRIEQSMICQEKDGSTMNIHMTGSYTPVSTHMVTDIQSTNKHMTMQKMTVDSARIGDCAK
jgi:hypothetical protein